jgi:hypothetical protein
VIHDRLYCYDFHGLPFTEVPGLDLSVTALPDAAFYAAIYDKVTPDERFIWAKKYAGRMIADLLVGHTEPGSMLSWGAGTGLVEGELARAGWWIEAVEPGASEHWPAGVPRFAHIDEVSGQYDVVMTVSTLYSQTDADCLELIGKFAAKVKPGGLLLLAEQDTRSVAGAIYGALADLLRHTAERGAQFWGYLRGPSWYRRHTPLEPVWSRYYALNADWSYREIDPPLRLFDRQLLSRRSTMQFHLFQKDT